MVIGIDASRANKAQKTGTEWYAFHVIQELIRLDQKNQYVLYTREPLNKEWGTLPPHVTVKLLRWPFRFIWTHLRLSWEMLIQAPDVLFVPAHSVPLIHRRRTVVTIHDLGFLHQPEIYRLLARWYHRFSAWWSVRMARDVITISEFTRQDIIDQYHIDPERIHMVPLGITKSLLTAPPTGESVREKFNITKPYFLYVGRIEKKKNIGVLLVAWRLFQTAHTGYELVLAGKDSYGGQTLSQQLEALPTVRKVGYVSENEKASLLSGAEGFVFPSLFEGFGLPLLEAMAVGCPVLCSQTTALPEVGGEAAWYFDPNEPEEIAKLMHKLVADPEARDVLIKRGKERVTQFSWQRTAELTLPILV